MGRLSGQQVLLAVSGGIAAYKAVEFARRMLDRGAEVRVVMTRAATEFVTPLTFQAATGHPVHTELFDPAAEAAMGHIELARWAERIVVAPATADVIARLALGLADDLLGTVWLASAAERWVAPAMNQQMWRHPATARNVERLRGDGVRILGPGAGAQACGDTGPGRLLEPDELVDRLDAQDPAGSSVGTPSIGDRLHGRRIVITAGPTREAIDPVRYISNHSTGRQGFALAESAARAGAEVVLVAGPVSLPTPEGVRRVDVVSARQMLEAVETELGGCDAFIAVAAVADYRPAETAAQKLKKGEATDALDTIRLVENPDILATVAARSPRPFCVGFAAETERVLEHARAKRLRKGADLIVANDVSDPTIGFASTHNRVQLIGAGGERSIEGTKAHVADGIIGAIADALEARP